MILNSLQNNLEELQNKHPEYASLVTDTEFILMWFKILARDVRRSCDQECTKMLHDPHKVGCCNYSDYMYCNYYDSKYTKCILDMLIDEQYQNRY